MPGLARRDQDPTTDAGLLERTRNLRDGSAWDDLFRRYDGTVRRYCRGATSARGDVEDLAPRVWLRLVEKLPGFAHDPSRSFRGWLRTLSRNAANDHYRELGRSPRAEPLGERDPASPGDLTTGVGRRRPTAEEAAAVEEAVRKRVGADSWEIFRRCSIHGERLSDVARDMNKRYGTAYMAWERVRNTLREEGKRRRGEGTPTN